MQHEDGAEPGSGKFSVIPLPGPQPGYADMPGLIRFGELAHQTISSDVASMMLTLWRDRNPAWFGAVLAEAMTGEPPRGARGRKAGQ